MPRLEMVWVDQGYTGDLEKCAEAEIGCRVEVVRRPAGQQGFQVLPRRWVVERSFGWLNRYRRLSKDFEYWEESSETMIKIAFLNIMLKRLTAPN